MEVKFQQQATQVQCQWFPTAPTEVSSWQNIYFEVDVFMKRHSHGLQYCCSRWNSPGQPPIPLLYVWYCKYVNTRLPVSLAI